LTFIHGQILFHYDVEMNVLLLYNDTREEVGKRITMVEKRKYERYQCKIKTRFNYYEGNPDEVDFDITVPSKGRGLICDISLGGIFIITKERVAVGMPAHVLFKIKKNKYSAHAHIVRTGLLKNNPSEAAKIFSKFYPFGDSYIVMEFKEPIQLSPDEL
jgi:hypothetical protein